MWLRIALEHELDCRSLVTSWTVIHMQRYWCRELILRDKDVMLTVVKDSLRALPWDVLLTVVSPSPRQPETCHLRRTVSDSVAWRPRLGGSQECVDEEKDSKTSLIT